MAVRSWSRPAAALALPLLLLCACQSTPTPPETTAAAEPAPAPKPPVRVARASRSKRAEAACKGGDLTAQRKEALFRQFAAAQDGAEIAIAPEPPQPQAGCRPGEK